MLNFIIRLDQAVINSLRRWSSRKNLSEKDADSQIGKGGIVMKHEQDRRMFLKTAAALLEFDVVHFLY